MTATSSRRDALLALLAAGGTLPLAACANAGGDEGPCADVVGHPVRLIGPDSAVTMDYNPERVNIHHDGDFVITQITFG